jgi:hypothetical protein
MEMLDIVSDDFIVNCYKAIEQYLLSTRSANLPLDMLPMIYENICKQQFPIPLSIIARGLLDHLFILTTPATGVVFVEVARLPNTSREGILAAHRDRISRLRDAMAPKPAEIANDRVAKTVQLILRGLHRALELNPLPGNIKSANELDSFLCNIFFKCWHIPLLLDGTGLASALGVVETFPRVFNYEKVSGKLSPLPNPDFTVGRVSFVPKSLQDSQKSSPTPTPTRMLTVEHAQMVDTLKSAMALLKVELLECGRDRDKYNMLSGKLSVKQKQLDELMNSLAL